MALITKQVKVSNKVEDRLAKILGVDKTAFKRVKYVTPFIFRHSYFVYNNGKMIGTANYFWDIRKPQQFVIFKRFSDDKLLKVRHLNNPKVDNFFNEEE